MDLRPPSRDKLWYFKAAPVFAGTGLPILERLMAASTMRQIPARQTIYRAGDRPDMVYLLKEGQVRLTRTDAEGHEATIAILGPLDLFGEQSLSDAQSREESAQAMTPSLICDMPRGEFLAALEGSPSLTVNVMHLLTRRIQRLESRLADLLFKGAEARLCTVLLQLVADHGRPAEGGAVDVPLTLTARDLGLLAGLARPTTAMLLSDLRQAGLIETSRGRLRLLDVGRLRRRAGR